MNEITVVVLDRPRHHDSISRIKESGARVKLIAEGDIFGAVSTIFDQCGADMLLGIGAAPEGVLAATALKIAGGYFEGRLKPRNEEETKRAEKMGVEPDKIYKIDELVKGNDALFIATGVTGGEILKGVKMEGSSFITDSVVVCSSQKNKIRFLKNCR